MAESAGQLLLHCRPAIRQQDRIYFRLADTVEGQTQQVGLNSEVSFVMVPDPGGRQDRAAHVQVLSFPTGTDHLSVLPGELPNLALSFVRSGMQVQIKHASADQACKCKSSMQKQIKHVSRKTGTRLHSSRCHLHLVAQLVCGAIHWHQLRVLREGAGWEGDILVVHAEALQPAGDLKHLGKQA